MPKSDAKGPTLRIGIGLILAVPSWIVVVLTRGSRETILESLAFALIGMIGVGLVVGGFRQEQARRHQSAAQKPLGRRDGTVDQADLPPASTAAAITSVQQMREHVKSQWSDKRANDDHA